MLLSHLIVSQLDFQKLCLPLDKCMLCVYIYISSESTKRNVYRYSEVVHIMWLQDYPFICLYIAKMCAQPLWD